MEKIPSHQSNNGEPLVTVPLSSLKAHEKAKQDFIDLQNENLSYVELLEALLIQNHIELPRKPSKILDPKISSEEGIGQIKDSSREEILAVLKKFKMLHKPFHVNIDFNNLTLWTNQSKPSIPTVGTAFKHMICGSGSKERVNLLTNLTGRIAPYKMTLLLGPPGCGRSLFMKTLSGRLKSSNIHVEGDIVFNGDNINSKKFLVRKLVDYIEENDTHAATLTVEETLKYAWASATGGHHSYALPLNDVAARELNKEDTKSSRVNNSLIALGLNECRKTYVGDNLLKGISGGQKRRVTCGEMLILPRPVKMMDSISNGLDSATTFDIIRALKELNHVMGTTFLISLLQPSPEVYQLFDDIILMSEGQIIYHGSRKKILGYFENFGYRCPNYVDEADFLQELPTPEGRKYIIPGSDLSLIPLDTKSFVECWKQSDQFKSMENDIKENLLPIDPYSSKEMPSQSSTNSNNVEITNLDSTTQSNKNDMVWPPIANIKYAGSYYFHFKLTLFRQIMMTIRDRVFIKSRIFQSLVVGGIAGSLFNNIPTKEVSTMNGFLFFTMLFGALANFAMLPIVYNQKKIFLKHSDAYFYPTSVFTLTQALVLYPLQFLENIAFCSICYWSAGLSKDDNGSRFLTFIVVIFLFCTCIAQLFRMIAFIMPDQQTAAPLTGVAVILMVLFSGFIQPKSVINDGWIWFYWINPVAWALKAITINQLKSPEYDFKLCLNVHCTKSKRFGDYVLEAYGNPTDENYIWYSIAILAAEYIFFFVLSNFILDYVRLEPKVQRPIQVNQSQLVENENTDALSTTQLPFEVVNFQFKDIWYTVTLPGGDDIDLLKSVTGYFEPGSITALMGSSGAGKTTLLDVLSGRKNSGVIRGEIYVNGKPKVERHFRKIMAYVEQFDSLSQKATARENIEFSAALRLPNTINYEQRAQWVSSILEMLELEPLENTLVGAVDEGGMSFEQRKRVSIGVELASNPSILFLDEPTSGLDSRAAQVIVRNIRKIASSGRCVVCTIHQPSTPIFFEFDNLLLLMRGGQTVYFGPLGEKGESLINYFQAIPTIKPIVEHQNPAVWMLEVIGAGTTLKKSTIDFPFHYVDSPLCSANIIHLNNLLAGNRSENSEFELIERTEVISEKQIQINNEVTSSDEIFNIPFSQQFYWLARRTFLTYWRTPSYNFVRFMVNIIVALIFSSAYPNQHYTDTIGTVSRSAVIYITTMFDGIIGLLTVVPVTFADRSVFYREQQSNMYSIALYTVLLTIVEIPYVLASSLAFVLPFFYIVGFNHPGNEVEKFFWYWLFHSLYLLVLVYIGQLFVALLPTHQVVQVATGLTGTSISLFCGFLITQTNIPTFWMFMYWLNPLHYTLEGLIMTQFHDDNTLIRLSNGVKVTAETYITQYYDGWNYDNVGYDVLALVIFILFLRVGTYICLLFFRHEKR